MAVAWTSPRARSAVLALCAALAVFACALRIRRQLDGVILPWRDVPFAAGI